LLARYTQESARIGAIASEVLVNGSRMKVVNIPSTKMMKKIFSAQIFAAGAEHMPTPNRV
jgi:hypothetical protein